MSFRSLIFTAFFATATLFFAVTVFMPKALAQSQQPILPLPEYAPSAAESLPTVSLHGGLFLTYYRPNQSWADEYFELKYAYLVLDSTYMDYGLHVEGRFRETPLEDYYTSNVWFQESYLYYRQPLYILKIGKTYTHLGLFWDGSMYGNVLSFDGLKLSPDDGFSFEGHLADHKSFGMNYFLQYFITDGQTNASLDGQHSGATVEGIDIDQYCDQINPPDGNGYRPCYYRTGRDTISIDGADRRSEIVGRLEPHFKIGEGDLGLGFSYMFLLADMTTLPPPPNAENITPGRYNVHRYEYDISYTRGPFSIFFEFDHQHGQSVLDYPDTGRPSQKIYYYWAGTSYKTGRWKFYYNYSEAVYQPYNLHNVVQVPGFTYDINKYAQFIFEYGYMYRVGNVYQANNGGFYMNDNSLNFYLKAAI